MLTAQQVIRYKVLEDYYQLYSKEGININLTGEQVDDAFEALLKEEGEIQDVIDGVRYGIQETDIKCPISRHYETKSVATQAPNGQWAGWTFYYGGGKHSEPELIEWIEDAYLLNCVEEEQLITIRKFNLMKNED
ncbi:hypothetical protein [Photorhabdus hindustanensis]|uniref:Uncharacterized protein n=1 Tax=Photorhabdus hindustanensis TaxID=2918802 RepID=A0A2S8PV78_9GAMM|nr:hypothetical protein [Photorhabdus hindustanensis]PQQ22789.1 hypothetical protein C6H66_22140 [Photorhabdus hindustanensis]